MTIVIALTKGSVDVQPLHLVKQKSDAEKARDFLGIAPLPIAGAIFLGILGIMGVGRYWWLTGRDRWYGDVHYLTENQQATTRPLFAKDTIVVEYMPPELERRKRRLRPAEIGTLLDERADTLDVTATIVDLAVRGYLRITEVERPGSSARRTTSSKSSRTLTATSWVTKPPSSTASSTMAPPSTCRT